MDYLVSVVVPTRNRYKYLKHLIKLIDSFHLDGLEMVIQDNSCDNSEIVDYLQGFNNPNIKYYYSTKTLTMSQNSELGILNATGEYVCFIGDDDGVCRNIVDCAKWMKTNGYDVVRNRVAAYYWKGIGILETHKKNYEDIDISKELDRLVKRGLILLDTKLPTIYQSIVKRSTLLELYDSIGTLFPGNPPDISGAIAISYTAKKCCDLMIPVVVNGTSKMTGGGVLKEGGILPLEKVEFISQKDIAEWEPCLPKIWVGAYAWYNSGVKAFRKMGHPEMAGKADINMCLASAVKERPWRIILWKNACNYTTNKVKEIYLIVFALLKRLLRKMYREVFARNRKYKSLSSIISAEEFFVEKGRAFGKLKD